MRYQATAMKRATARTRPVVELTFAYLLLLAVLLAPVHANAAGAVADKSSTPAADDEYGQVPLHFQVNEGQAPDFVRYLAKGNGYSIFLGSSDAYVVLKRKESREEVLHMQLLGANADPTSEPQQELGARVNYLKGNDASEWIRNAKTYGRTYYREVYKGIDVVYYGTDDRRLEYDFVVAPKADPSDIRLGFDGAKGIHVNDAGELVFQMTDGDVQMKAPYTYQEIDGRRVEIESRYVIHENGEVGFVVGDYDANRTLVIDPILIYGTYLGGLLEDVVNDVAVDKDLQAYVVGYTKSGNFPTEDPIQFNNFFPGGADYDIFVSKFSADGQTLLFSTYIGGSATDEGRGIAVDKDGHIYITGFTDSDDFPTDVADDSWDDSHNGGKDVFLTKIHKDGTSLVYSTYMGSSDDDIGNDLALFDDDEVFVVGTTDGNLPDDENSPSGGFDAFVAEFDEDGDLEWTRYVGGDEDDFGNDVAVADDFEPVIVGTTESDTDSDGFPITPGAIQSLFSGGVSDAFVARIKHDGTDEIYVTYIGGSDDDEGLGIDVDDEEDVYAVGKTKSADFSGAGAPNVHDNDLDGASDGFLVKLRVEAIDPLLYSTFIGGSGDEKATSVAVDSQKRAHVVGETTSSNFPDTPDANQGILKGASDAFVAIYNDDASDLIYATYHGGTGDEDGLSIAVDKFDDSYIVGKTSSSADDLPTASFQTTYGGGDWDGFVAKFGINADLEIVKTVDDENPLVGDQVTYTLTVINNGPDDVSYFEVLDALPAGTVFDAYTGDCSESSEVVECDGDFLAAGDEALFTITVNVPASITIENCGILTNPYHDPDTGNNTSCETIVPHEQRTFWQNANTEAGTVTALAHTDDVPPLKGASAASGTILAGTDGGGVYRSTDGGDNWFPTSLVRTGDDVNVRGIAVDSEDGDIFVITFGRGMFHSDDILSTNDDRNSGLSSSEEEMLSIVLNPFNPDDSDSGLDSDIFVGTAGKGVLKSEDDGNTWDEWNGTSPKALGNKIVRALAIVEVGHSTQGDLLFAGTHGGGVWRGWTKGTLGFPEGDWGSFNTGLENLIVHALHYDATNGHLYAGTNDGIYKNTAPTGAGTWTREDLFDPGYWLDEPVVRSFTQTASDTLYAGTDGSYIFQKAPGATEWEWTGKADPSSTMQYNLGLQSSTVLALLAAPDEKSGDPDVVFAGTQDHGVHRFDVYTRVWEQVSNETINAVIQAMTMVDVSGDHDLLFGGTYGFGILMSDDFNSQPFVNWTQVNKGLSNTWVYAMEQVERNGTNYVFAGTWNGGVFRSTDFGENWHFSGLAHRIVYDIAINDDDVVYAATDRGEVARSIDQGLTWQEIGVATTAIWSLGIEDSNTIYAGTFGAGISKSEDGGISWTKTGMTSGHVFDFAFGDHPDLGDGVFAATATGVKFSDDDGATWVDFSTGLTVPDTRAVAVHPNDDDLILAATWGGGVFTYDDKSRSWIRDGLPQMPVTAFAIHPGTGEVFVGTDDGGLFRKKFVSQSSVGTDEPNGELPTEFALGQNYPNPFNPTTNIEFALPEAQDIRLTIYDALGRQVSVLVDGQLAAGTHQVTFEAADLPSGVYFYRLDSANQSLTQKMILMK